MSGIAEYRRRTHARHRPVVAVASAPEVDACLARSGLTLVDALRPWSDVRGISFSVRLNPESGYPHVLNEFRVRFHDARECARVPDDVADAHAAEALTPWSPADAHGLASALEGVPSNVPSLIAHARGEDGMTTPGDKPTGVRDGTNREKVFAAPWLDAYHARFDRAMQFADHEAVDHPVGIVYAVMANTPGEDPGEAYRRLAEDPNVFPPVLRDTTLADADVPRHCLLVHDASSPSAPTDADLDALRTSMQNSIGAAANGGVFILPVNGAREPVSGRADAWTPHVETRLVAPVGIEPGTVGSSPRGAYLSDEDVERHKVFVAELVNMSLLPSMDRRAKSLNAVIIANRKGLKNQLKSFWGRSTGQIVKPEGDGGYARDSIESQMRRAADLSMALRDYEGAAGLYRLLAADYKADKAWRRLGAAQESLGHALAMSATPRRWSSEGPPHREARREAEAALESAAGCHARASVLPSVPEPPPAGSSAPSLDGSIPATDRARWATKAGLAHAAFLASCGAHRECASPLMRASAEDSQNHVRAALLLEGAAHAYLRSEVPMPRKCAIHMVLAGHRFNQAQLRAFAVRCYASALTVYAHEGAPLGRLAASWSRLRGVEGEVKSNGMDPERVRTGDLAGKVGWSRAKEHLHFALGRQAAAAGEMSGACRYFRELLTCAESQPAATQATYLKEYLFVCQRAMETLNPTLNPEPAGDGSDEKDATKSKANPPVPVIDAGDVSVHFNDTRVDLGFTDGLNMTTNAPKCATWPRATWNALEDDGLVPPGLQGGGATWLDKPREKGGVQRGVCAAGETIGVDVAMTNPLKVEVNVTDTRLVCESEEEVAGQNSSPGQKIVAAGQSVTLAPKETKTVRLTCTPTTPGRMKILGLAWTLSGVESGYVPFDVRAPRTRRAAQTQDWVRDVPREKRLAFTAVEAPPKVTVSLTGVPTTIPHGASVLVQLRVKNASELGGPVANRVRVRLPGGGVCVPADDEVSGELINGGGWSGTATPSLSANSSFADLAKLNLEASKPGGPPRREVPLASSPASLAGLVYAPAAWSSLAAGEEVCMNIWLHPTGKLGPLDLPIVVFFELPAPAPALLKYRTVRLAAGTVVTPSVTCAVTAHHHTGDPSGRVLKVSLAHADVSRSDPRASSFAMTRVTLVRAAEGNALRLTPLGHPTDKPRIAAPGTGWDTILALQSDAGDDGSDSDNSGQTQLQFGVGDAPPSPAPPPPHVRLHRAKTPLDFTAAPPPFPGSLLGVDAIVEWLEVLPPGVTDRTPSVGACHVFNVAGTLARDPQRARVLGKRAVNTNAGGVPDMDVRWTLVGPGVVTLPEYPGASVEIPVTLRAHNPSPNTIRLTFQSTCGEVKGEGGWKRATAIAGWGEPASAVPVPTTPPPVAMPAPSTVATPPPPTPTTPPPPPMPKYPIRTMPPGRAWMWTGAVKKTVTVRPGETLDVPLRAEALAKGVFVLKDYKLTWCNEEGGRGVSKVAHPPQACNAPFVVEVK